MTSLQGNVHDINFTVHWLLLQVHFFFFLQNLTKIKLSAHLIKTPHLANLKVMKTQ